MATEAATNNAVTVLVRDLENLNNKYHPSLSTLDVIVAHWAHLLPTDQCVLLLLYKPRLNFEQSQCNVM